MKWLRKTYRPGSMVNVMDAPSERFLGTGVLLTRYSQGCDRNKMPLISLPGGRIIHGYECWWIPCDEAGSCLLPPRETL